MVKHGKAVALQAIPGPNLMLVGLVLGTVLLGLLHPVNLRLRQPTQPTLLVCDDPWSWRARLRSGSRHLAGCPHRS